MHRFALSAALVLAASQTAYAGPVEVPPALPPVVVDNCPLDFDCFYVGLEYGHANGEGTSDVSPTFSVPLDFEGDIYGAFAGYNFQDGSLVYGGELRYLHLSFDNAGVAIDSVLDARARVGFAVSDQILVYAAAGYSTASATAAAVDFNMTGFNYGIGAEYNVSERVFVGVDVTGRDLEGSVGVLDYESTVNAATLRLGFRF